MDFPLILSAITLLLVVGLIVSLRGRQTTQGSGEFDKQLGAVRDELARNISQSQMATDAKFETFRSSLDQAAKAQRDEAAAARQEIQRTLSESLVRVSEEIKLLSEGTANRLIQVQNGMRDSMDRMQKSNESKLEEMRLTVDEKLQGTLEKRLGESFKQVSDKLEAVHQGLGAMQNLAGDVGNLQKVLTNVKNRGGWGEAQLGAQLEDMLSPGQYEANVKTKKNSNDLVEFAIKLPGQDDGEFVYLPIDSKFPQESYERLLAAQDANDLEAIAAAGKEIERTIKAEAKKIQEKYIDAPHTTDFAIMYLPTEGLFAEVIRRPGLISDLQSQTRVLVSGPTTLMSLLNSLQMGFRTLAIQKNASDVWKILEVAKAEFRKFGDVWDKVGRQLEATQNTVKDASVRSRAIERALKNVESVASIESSQEFMALENQIQDGEILEPDQEAGD